MHRPSTALAAVLSTFAFASTAAADSYCVAPATGCDHAATSLHDALTQSAARAGDDSISLGAATYAEDALDYSPGDGARVSITGAGQDATTIQPATSATGTLTLKGSTGPVDLTALTVRTGTGTADIALQLFYGGNLDRIQVLAGEGAVQPNGIEDFRDSAITNSRFDLPGTGKCIAGGGSGTVSVRDSTIANCSFGVSANASHVFAQRLRMTNVLTAIYVLSGTANLDDSLVHVRGGSWAAVVNVSGTTTATLYLNQDTIIGAGSGPGATAYNHASTGSANVHVYDSILRGFSNPLSEDSDSGSHPASMGGDYIDYEGTPGVVPAHPTTADPLFVDPANGDYHLQAGSPLIDQDPFAIDVPGGESPTDLDGSVRIINAKRDLGAFERPLAPGAAAGAATDVTQTGATVPVTANGGGAHASVTLVYGPTTAYGSEVRLDATPADFTDHSSSTGLTGLAPGTTYHYALVASNSAGTATSPDQVFTTGSTPPACCAPPVAKAALSALRISPSRFKAATKGATFAKARTGAKVTFTLSAAGIVKFTVFRAKRSKGHTHWVKVGRVMSRTGGAGANRLRFSGRVAGKRLKPGRYRLQSLDPSGATRRAGFSIVRR